MSGQLEENIKRWTARRESALVIQIIEGKTTVAEASRVIGDWIQFYNHRRPHQALAMRTPNEAFELAA